MYQVRQSATGQFVLVHAATDTVVVADDLREAYDKIRALTPSADAADAAPPAMKPIAAPSPWPKLGMIAVLAVLPFIWIGALHVSLGRLVAELRAGSGKEDAGDDEVRTRLERLELRLDQLGGDRRAARPSKPARPAAAATPVAAAADSDETGEEG